MEQERSVGADFLVSVEAECENELSTITDKLTDTISYADMAEVVKQEMQIPSQLLEHAAGRIGRRLLADFPTLSQVTVRLTKLAPPITGLQCEGAGIVLNMKN